MPGTFLCDCWHLLEGSLPHTGENQQNKGLSRFHLQKTTLPVDHTGHTKGPPSCKYECNTLGSLPLEMSTVVFETTSFTSWTRSVYWSKCFTSVEQPTLVDQTGQHIIGTNMLPEYRDSNIHGCWGATLDGKPIQGTCPSSKSQVWNCKSGYCGTWTGGNPPGSPQLLSDIGRSTCAHWNRQDSCKNISQQPGWLQIFETAEGGNQVVPLNRVPSEIRRGRTHKWGEQYPVWLSRKLIQPGE